MERMSKELLVGAFYENAEGICMKVLAKVVRKAGSFYKNRQGEVEQFTCSTKENFENMYHVINENGAYDLGDYGNGYIVNSVGGFGNCPNMRDLVKPL